MCPFCTSSMQGQMRKKTIIDGFMHKIRNLFYIIDTHDSMQLSNKNDETIDTLLLLKNQLQNHIIL